MPLLGRGAVAMWWTIEPALHAEFGDWHSHEHFPERLGIPGFRRGSRWAHRSTEGGFFVLYELADYETLVSEPYLARLNDPTPWSTKMMPHHLGMVRSQCRVLASHGGGLGGALVTLRLSPAAGAVEGLEHRLGALLAGLPDQPGLTGAHLLRTETPPVRTLTAEQRIRGGDSAADWVVIVSGYDPASVIATVRHRLGDPALQACGVARPSIIDEFALSFALTPADMAV